ncbi:MAG: hypothetical protein LH609_19790 [Rudanella sp.]|nr:hypothetical protein [Rudanella sp.]
MLIESPSHGFSGKTDHGEAVVHTPEMLIDAQLICHQTALQFLAAKGGRSSWTPARNQR